MTDNRQKIIGKIKKCLALSRSANEYEAAQALKHAQAMMREYGLNETDISLAEITEELSRAPKTAPSWHWNLVRICALAFGCEYWHRNNLTGSGFIFCGINGRPELAAYAYEVLLRRLKAARREYIKTALSRVKIAKNKTARADEFCTGWVHGVQLNVQEFAGTEAETALVTQYMERHRSKMKTAKMRDVKGARKNEDDYWQGRYAGKEVGIDRPISQSGGYAQLGRVNHD